MEHGRSHYHCLCGRKTRLLSTAERHVRLCASFHSDSVSCEKGRDDAKNLKQTPVGVYKMEQVSDEHDHLVASVEHSAVTIPGSDDFKTNYCMPLSSNVPVRGKTLNCNLCNKVVSKKNIRRHIRTHKKGVEANPNVCCVDESGIFLVEKHKGPGPVVPLHVKVRTLGEDSGLVCTERDCQEILPAMNRGHQNFLCPHLSNAINAPNCISKSNLPLTIEVQMSTDMKRRVLNLKRDADQHQAPLLVKWPYSYQPNCTFYSVYTGCIRPWCQLGRTVVTVQSGRVVCPCVGTLHNCVHKAVVRWVENLPAEETPGSVCSLPPDNSSCNTSSLIDKDWLKYLSENKIHPDSHKEYDSSVEFGSLIPSEVECPWCRGQLDTCLSTEKAVVVDQNFIKKGRLTQLHFS